MKTEITVVTKRGQVSVPASIRERMGLKTGQKLSWELQVDNSCSVRPVEKPHSLGMQAVRGYARTFRKPLCTSQWMDILREGEQN